MGIAVRLAREDEATQLCDLLRCSITQLCTADHKNDPTILSRWLENKTPATLASWIADPASTLIVAEEEAGDILAVGGLLHSGEISLNYVHPRARGRGISKMIVRDLEARAKALGLSECKLNSTGTARRFYLSLGYSEGAPEVGFFGTTVYPMAKGL